MSNSNKRVLEASLRVLVPLSPHKQLKSRKSTILNTSRPKNEELRTPNPTKNHPTTFLTLPCEICHQILRETVPCCKPSYCCLCDHLLDSWLEKMKDVDSRLTEDANYLHGKWKKIFREWKE